MALRGGPSYAYLCDQLETVGLNHAWIEPMAAGTGWSTGTWSEDVGFGALSVTATDTAVNPTKDYDADFTLRRYTHIRMWIDDVSKLATLTFRTYDAALNQIGSHNLLTGAARVAVSGWNDLVIGRSAFPTNHRRIRFNVQATAGQSVTVHIGAIQTCDLRPLCTIWTDDAKDSVYDLAYPVLAARGLRAVVSVPSDFVGTAGHMTLANVQTLDAAGWDICNHASTNADLTTLTEAQVRAEVGDCMTYLDGIGIGAARHLFVHPMAKANANTRTWVSDYAWMDRSRSSDNSRIPVEWISVGGKDIRSEDSVAAVKAMIDAAITDQEWLILVFHNFTADAPSISLEYNTDDFDEILAYLQASEIDVVTATGAVGAMAPNYALTGDDTVAVLDRATAYWKGVDYSGSGDWLDGSGNGHDATPRNSPTFSGGAWTLNGSTQDFQVANHADLDVGVSDSVTVLVLAAKSAVGYGCLLSKRQNAITGSAGYLLYAEPDNMRFEVSDGTTEDFGQHDADHDINPELFSSTTAWAGTRDVPNDRFKVAREGTYYTAVTYTDDTTGSFSNAIDLYIGSLGGGAYFWNGTISGAAIWVGETLSEADLATAATELATPTPTSGGSTPSGIAGNYGINIAVRVGI